MTRQTVQLLTAEMDEAWETLGGRLEGLTDEEFLPPQQRLAIEGIG